MTTGDSKEMKNHSAILFPHSYLPSAVRERIFSSFAALTICQPWYMGGGEDTETRDGRIHIVHPSEDLRPPKNFMKLLAEYRLWMSQNRGYTPLPLGTGEGATWEIRHALRHTGKDVREPVEEQPLKWHLILHLERELEENRASADEMLLRVKTERSPLAEALGETPPSHGLLDDLPVSDSYPSMEERHLKQVLSAWFGLFGASVAADGILVTMAPEVLGYAEELFETGSLELSMEGSASSFRRILLPASSIDSRMEKDPVRAGLSGRTLILMD
ncbi:MAG: hypothetical protein QG552_3353 [Thermodesulfobacteriota bacterium]|nr:hypothetical protein [Thermodesulfobacteriota bacterium]